MDQVEKLAGRQKLTKSLIIEAAVAAFLSPDSTDRREAAFARRLDLLTRQVERLERNVEISAEAVALFVRFWLTTTPPALDSTEPAAQTKGRKRYQGFVEAVGRRVAKGQSLVREILQDLQAASAETRTVRYETMTPKTSNRRRRF